VNSDDVGQYTAAVNQQPSTTATLSVHCMLCMPRVFHVYHTSDISNATPELLGDQNLTIRSGVYPYVQHILDEQNVKYFGVVTLLPN